MIAHTVTAYDEELKSLRQKIFHMGGLAEHQVMTAMSAIAGADNARAKQAVAGDAAIDAMQREIEV
ncbi:MAG: PhoU domain-containing protein, partial [Rhodomicrobium sp.]